MGLSRRAYAALRGVHESAVRKAIATGRITTEADGTIDAAKADAMWDASTDPAKQRGAHARDLGRGTAAATRAVAGTKAVPRQAFAAVAETLTEAGADPGAAAGDGGEAIGLKAGHRGGLSGHRKPPFQGVADIAETARRASPNH